MIIVCIILTIMKQIDGLSAMFASFAMQWRFFKSTSHESGHLSYQPSLSKWTDDKDRRTPPIANIQLSEEQMSSLSDRVRKLLVDQQTQDRAHYQSTPLVSMDVEFPFLYGQLQKMDIGQLITRTKSVTIIESLNFPNMILKYQSECEEEEKSVFNPLLRDYWFLSILNETGIVPKVFFISPGTVLTSPISIKTNFEKPEKVLINCIHRTKSSLRYMVMEKGDKSLMDLIRAGPMPVIEALKILSQLIEGIQFLHKHVRAIHGDIHPGNILINKDGRVQLIDFELAEFEDELIHKTKYIGGHMSFVHCYLSHWNIEGSRFSYRDDVIKALYVTAFLIHGNSFLETCLNMANTHPWSLYSWKKSKFLFDLPHGGGVSMDTLLIDRTKYIKDCVRARLEIITDMARSVTIIDDQPPYASMIEKIDSIVKVLLQ